MEARGSECTSSAPAADDEASRSVATPCPAATSVETLTTSGTAVVSNTLAVSSPTSAARIFSRNVNGTLVQTSVPQNEAELQLYRVMQRASLLGYYDTLLEMGGDDVQQLCDAGEEEFLEIMALVGMASKPLHVRRMQKTLQEWVTNPALFQTPVVSSNPTCQSTISGAYPCPSPRPQFPVLPTQQPYSCPVLPLTPLPCRSSSPSVNAPLVSTVFRHSPSPSGPVAFSRSHSPGVLQVGTCESSCGSGTTASPGGAGGADAPASPTQPTPALLQSQVQRLSETAKEVAATMKPLDPKPHNIKKKICKDLEMVIAMPNEDPRRMEEIRKYAAIYGRFDCKRKPEKPLTLHEVSVNEAAAQICRFHPALLTRRDQLFSLARRVVRESGYHYSKNQYITMTRMRENGDDVDQERTKRRCLELEADGEDSSQAEIDLRYASNSPEKRCRSSSPIWRRKNSNGTFDASPELSDSESQMSFSNGETSSLHDANDGETDNTDRESDFNLKIIASRGDDIIAVANPALRLSSPIHTSGIGVQIDCTSIKEEPADEEPAL